MKPLIRNILCLMLLIAGGFASSSQFVNRDFSEQDKLTASDGMEDDWFGSSIAVDGDTMLIGAPIDDSDMNPQQGSVYVFMRDGDNWVQQTKLTASDGGEFDLFGFAVAIADDTALISAVLRDEGGNIDQGVVYVFTRSGNTWTEQQKLTASDGAANDNFGNTVVIEGDTAMVGAIFSGGGAVYEFTRSGGVWTEHQKLVASDNMTTLLFGIAVSMVGDTTIIGAQSNTINDQGAAYVFTRSGGSWTEQQKLTPSDGASSDGFGRSVNLSGNTALIGAMGANINPNPNQGAAYVFTFDGISWTEQQKLTASDGAAHDNFGIVMAVQGDIALFGVLSDDINGNDSQGSAYVFTFNGGSWTEQQKLIASDGASFDQFGGAVALQDTELFIGAAGVNIEFNTEQGSVYVFVDPALAITPTPTDGATLTATPTSEVTSTVTPTVEITLTPTDTPTLEPGTTELVQNGGFEAEAVAPWTIKNASGDKRKCNKDKDGDGIPDKIVVYAGNCAFQFKNVVGEAGKIQQTLDLSGIIPAVGDTLDLNFYVQSKGGATVKAKLVFKYDDETKTKISVESDGSSSYTQFMGSSSLTNANVVKANINLKSSQTSGKVYVDEVSLGHTSSGLIPPPAAQLDNRN